MIVAHKIHLLAAGWGESCLVVCIPPDPPPLVPVGWQPTRRRVHAPRPPEDAPPPPRRGYGFFFSPGGGVSVGGGGCAAHADPEAPAARHPRGSARGRPTRTPIGGALWSAAWGGAAPPCADPARTVETPSGSVQRGGVRMGGGRCAGGGGHPSAARRLPPGAPPPCHPRPLPPLPALGQERGLAAAPAAGHARDSPADASGGAYIPPRDPPSPAGVPRDAGGPPRRASCRRRQGVCASAEGGGGKGGGRRACRRGHCQRGGCAAFRLRRDGGSWIHGGGGGGERTTAVTASAASRLGVRGSVVDRRRGLRVISGDGRGFPSDGH